MGNKRQAPAWLASFQRVGKGMYLQTPTSEAKQSPEHQAGTPDLVILSTWMNAGFGPIKKYTDYYQQLYPASPLLLLTSSSDDFFFNSEAKQLARFQNVLATIRELADGESHKNGTLIHSFSNGGAGQVALVLRQYLQKFGHPVPAQAIIYDSAPGKARFKQGMTSFSLSLPKAWFIRIPIQAFISAMLFVFYVIPQLFGMSTLADTIRAILNSVEPSYLPKETKRCYIYSDADAQILDCDIEEHASRAKAEGFEVVTEKFIGTQHVDHMRHDPDRYWGIVKKTWGMVA